MDLHALTSKPEGAAKQPESQEPAASVESAPMRAPESAVNVSDLESDEVSTPPEPSTMLVPRTITGVLPAEQTTAQAGNVHDAVFWEVHGLVVYYLVLIGLTALFLLYVWGGDPMVLQRIGLMAEALKDPLLRTVGYTLVGSVFGSVLYQIRVLFKYYLGDKNYDRRWLGKYISAPWESAAMSLVVLALIRGGVALFGGGAGATATPTNNFATLSVGALVGFGMRDVVRWVQGLVETTFGTRGTSKPSGETQPPNNTPPAGGNKQL